MNIKTIIINKEECQVCKGAMESKCVRARVKETCREKEGKKQKRFFFVFCFLRIFQFAFSLNAEIKFMQINAKKV